MPLVIPFAAALVAILALLAFYEVTQAVTNVIRKIPFIGKYVANATETVLNLIYALLRASFAATAQVFTKVLNYPISAFSFFLNAAKDAISEIEGTVYWIAEHLIKHVYETLVHLIGSVVVAVETYAKRLVDTLETALRAAITHARAYAAALVKAATIELHLAIHGLRVAVYGSLHGLEKDLRGLIHRGEVLAAGATAAVATDLARVRENVWAGIHDARHDLAALVDSTAAVTLREAERFTTTSIKAIQGVITVDIPGVVAPVWDGLIDDIGALEGVLGSDFPDLSALLDSIPGVEGLDTALSIAGAATIARVLSRYLTRCGIPNCRNLSSFGRALQDLFGIVEGGAFLALLAELVSDPEGSARELESFLSPIVEPLVSGARDLLGV